ncbi:MAG: RDD family protein [Patescibacteria group bacterium]|jgi:uncharacterized RDD family membrane protein YckC
MEAFPHHVVAPLRSRFAAGCIDHFPVMLLMGVFLVAIFSHIVAGLPIRIGLEAEYSGYFSMLWRLVGFFGALTVTLYPVMVVVNIFLIAGSSASMGKHALRLKIIHEEDLGVDFMRALLREVVGKFLSTIVCGAGFFVIFFDERRRGWHDRLAKTYVVRKDLVVSPLPLHTSNEDVLG